MLCTTLIPWFLNRKGNERWISIFHYNCSCKNWSVNNVSYGPWNSFICVNPESLAPHPCSPHKFSTVKCGCAIDCSRFVVTFPFYSICFGRTECVCFVFDSDFCGPSVSQHLRQVGEGSCQKKFSYHRSSSSIPFAGHRESAQNNTSNAKQSNKILKLATSTVRLTGVNLCTF